MNGDIQIELLGYVNEFELRANSIIERKDLKPVIATRSDIMKAMKDLHNRIYESEWSKEKEVCYGFLYNNYPEVQEIYDLETTYTLLHFIEMWIKINHHTQKHPKQSQFSLFFTIKQLDQLEDIRAPLGATTYVGFVKYWDQIQRKESYNYLIDEYREDPKQLVKILQGEIPENFPREFLSFASLRTNIQSLVQRTKYLMDSVEKELQATEIPSK